jgi:hypothetical protein
MLIRSSRLALAALLVAGLTLLTGPQAALAAGGCSGVWRSQKGPIAGDENERLVATAVISPTDVWAAGDTEKQMFLEHWDGTSWTPNVNTPGKDSHPTDIAADASNDVWAVGFQGGSAQALSIHYNGRTWTQQVVARQGAEYEFDGVAPISSTDVWAVGEKLNGSKWQPLIMHWDGNKWTPFSSPATGTNAYLDGVDAVSTSNVWAVGTTYNGSRYTSLIEHWDGTSWTIASSPNASGDNQLTAVTAISANDIWAVGGSSSGGVVTPIALHYTGSSWTQASAPLAGGDNTIFESVSAGSTSNVYAVGAADDGTTTTTVVEHWNGSAWSVQSSPNIGTQYDTLKGVGVSGSTLFAVGATYKGRALQPAVWTWNGSTWTTNVLSIGGENWLRATSAISASDIWAVGSERAGNGWSPLTEHYDGHSWSVVPSAATADPYDVLTGVAAISTNDVWAVGQVFDGTYYHPFTEHWNGSAWSIVPTPDLGGPEGYLQSVSAVSSSDVWAAGETYNGTRFKPLLEHWNGSAWTVDTTLAAIAGDAQLEGISATSTNDVWAVGSTGDSEAQTLILHWNGSSWSQVNSPDTGDTSVLTSVSGLSSGNAWAVGYSSQSWQTVPLAEHWNGSSWSIVPTPSENGQLLSILLSVDARTPTDVWASGFFNTGAVTETLAMHYDGSTWELSTTPNVNTDDSNELDGIVSPSAGQVWAVGNQTQLGLLETLCPITDTASGFSPTPLNVPVGTLVDWAIPESAGSSHQIADSSKLGLFNSGSLAPGATFTYYFSDAGVFKQIDATTGKKGTVHVAPGLSAKSGSLTDEFTITYGTRAPPSGDVEDIQIQRPGSGGFVDWETGLTGETQTFVADAGTGTYTFRASLRKVSNGARSGWAKVSISVS